MRRLTLLIAVLLTGFLSVLVHAKTDSTVSLPDPLQKIDEAIPGIPPEVAADQANGGSCECNNPDKRCCINNNSSSLTENNWADYKRAASLTRTGKETVTPGTTETNK